MYKKTKALLGKKQRFRFLGLLEPCMVRILEDVKK